jgi:hypothetical protein
MVLANLLSATAIPIAFADSALPSHNTPSPPHLAIAAVLARSASAFASTLATSYSPTATALALSASTLAPALSSSHIPTRSSLTGPAVSSSNTTAPPRTTSWYSPPNTRGTWQLLITCLITINLCVWTAVHLNIPAKIDKKQTLRKRLWSNYYCVRTGWVLLGLLAPELVVYTAWMQWQSARVFVEKANKHRNRKRNIQERIEISQKPRDERIKPVHQEHAITLDPLQAESTRSIRGEDAETSNLLQDEDVRGIYTEDTETSNKPQDDNRRSIQVEDAETSNELHDDYGRRISEELSAVPDESQEVTMTHGFYAGMGSYYIDLDVPGEPSGKPHPKRLYLTASGVLASVKAGKLSLPPKEMIAERSKSDALAKTLVCLQAGYIIVQCISRLGSGLPLTFLEINTLGHVLCALIMYSFWFHKPQDLTLSVALESSFAKQLGAWYACCSCCFDTSYKADSFCDLYKAVFDRAKTAGSSKVFGSQRPPTSTQAAATALRERNVFEGFPQESDVATLGGDDCVLLLRVYSDLEAITKQIRLSDLWNMFTAVYCVRPMDVAPDYILTNPRVRCCQIYRSMQLYITLIERLLETKAEPLDYRDGRLEEEISNWPSKGLLSGRTFLPPVAIAISTALYGGLHAAAWHSFFPTEVEKWFWRVSSMVIAASGLLFAYGMVSNRLWISIFPSAYRPSVRWAARALEWVMELLSLDGSDFVPMTRFGVRVYTSLGACCVISRLYLVVESFISLRKVPVEVYQTPDWTQWIPHL